MDLDLSGAWIFHGHPWRAPHGGRIAIQLTQTGTTLRGRLRQLIEPSTGQPPPDPAATEADVIGEIIEHPNGSNHLVLLKRVNKLDSFRAVFVGTWDETQQTVAGTFTNTNPGGGTFKMARDFEQTHAKTTQEPARDAGT